MNINSLLEPFIGSTDHDVNTAAAKLHTYVEELNKGHITKKEFDFLVQDLKILESVNFEVDKLKKREQLNGLIDDLINLSSII